MLTSGMYTAVWEQTSLLCGLMQKHKTLGIQQFLDNSLTRCSTLVLSTFMHLPLISSGCPSVHSAWMGLGMQPCFTDCPQRK